MTLNNKFNVPSSKKPPSVDIATQAVLEKVANDPASRNGVGTIMTLLGNEGMSLPRSVELKPIQFYQALVFMITSETLFGGYLPNTLLTVLLSDSLALVGE